MNKVTKKELTQLADGEVLTLTHPYLSSVELIVRKESLLTTVLNIPTVMYGEDFIVEDNTNNVHPQHGVKLSNNEMISYLNELLESQTETAFRYKRTLKEKGLQIGDVIELQDGKRGEVVFPQDEVLYDRNIRFIPLKADGTRTKHKPRLLYGGVSFQKI